MYKSVHKRILPINYNPNHKHNHYFYNGKWYNAGQVNQFEIMAYYGITPGHDNTAFNEGSDIEKYSTSVKTFGFSLTDCVLGNDKDEILLNFALSCPSEWFTFVYFENNMQVVYTMALYEFLELLKKFTYITKSSKGNPKLKQKTDTNQAIVKWLENNLNNPETRRSFELCED